MDRPVLLGITLMGPAGIVRRFKESIWNAGKVKKNHGE
jgi:hypothetical protein